MNPRILLPACAVMMAIAAFVFLFLTSCKPPAPTAADVNRSEDDYDLASCRWVGRIARARDAGIEDAYARYAACKRDAGF